MRDQLLHAGCDRRAIGGGQRLGEAVRVGERDIVLVAQRAQHVAHERGVQQRRVDAADVDDGGAVADLRRGRRRCPAAGRVPRARPRRPRRPRAAAGRLWPRRAHDDDRPVDGARDAVPTARRSSVEPCQSSAAFGVPMRSERPPASTMPALRSVTERVREGVVGRGGRTARSAPPRPRGARRARPRVASIAIARRLVERVAVDAGRDRRQRDARAAVPRRELDRAAIAGGEQLGLAVVAAAPDRTDGVDDVARRAGRRRR